MQSAMEQSSTAKPFLVSGSEGAHAPGGLLYRSRYRSLYKHGSYPAVRHRAWDLAAYLTGARASLALSKNISAFDHWSKVEISMNPESSTVRLALKTYTNERYANVKL